MSNSRVNSKHKDPEVGVCLICSRSTKEVSFVKSGVSKRKRARR